MRGMPNYRPLRAEVQLLPVPRAMAAPVMPCSRKTSLQPENGSLAPMRSFFRSYLSAITRWFSCLEQTLAQPL